MTESLASLDALLLTVRNTESQRLAADALAAYRGGAYRAAIMSLWVAIATDLISKLRELSTRGDAGAKAEIEELDTLIAGNATRRLQAFEAGLIKKAEGTFGMLLKHEATALRRIHEDRNLCAHPAFVSEDELFSPNAELVRSHFVHTITYLLSRDPVQGKQLIRRFEKDLLGGAIPKSPDQLELVIRDNYTLHSKESSRIGLMKGLASSLVGKEAERFKRFEIQVAEALAALGRVDKVNYEKVLPPMFERWGKELSEDKLLDICIYMEAEPRVWNWLGNVGQIRILAKIENMLLDDLVRSRVFHARHNSAVGDKLLVRLQSEGEETLEEFIAKWPCPSFIIAGLDLFGRSTTFAMAGKRGRNLILSHAQYYKAEHFAILSRKIQDNKGDQILFAYQTEQVLLRLLEQATDANQEAKSAWEAIAEYIVGRFAHEEYPQLLERLKGLGFSVPNSMDPDDLFPA